MASTNVFEEGDLVPNNHHVPISSSVSKLASLLYLVFPTEKGTYPVLFFNHGFMCRCDNYSQILYHIASHGFIVAAPQKSKIVLSPTKTIKELANIADWLPTGIPPKLPDNVYADFTKFGLAGHSKGGNETFALALGYGGVTLKLKISALIGIDPVAPPNFPLIKSTEPQILTYAPRSFDFGFPAGVIGTGLGSESKNCMIRIPCAPDGRNHETFFKECRPPCCYFVAKDYGHMDMLDGGGGPLGCMCKSGTGPKSLMRKGTAGIVVAFMKAYLEGHDFDLIAIVNDPNIAPITLDPVVYTPH
ncbi:hypothetical protein M9H77_01451 [Catharanthus roseus]|uniref:Uncharacterized protein n=1 Tax=Catharanthus roseus TaxID=4058 RepID=A0ACC0C5L5_CATRO|nr:hypothetical protein M9H77_01451 [Catharanthus roseus]